MNCRRCSEAEAGDEAEFCDDCQDAVDAPVPHLDVRAIFAADGPLARGRAGYQPRTEQVRLSRAIMDALAGDTHLIAEGPTGIGKSMAYGVPAAHLGANGKRVLIVTGSIALQEQLISKDLPDLREKLGWDFTFALLKGKPNYLCLVNAPQEPMQGEYLQIQKWAKTTTTGDKSDLPFKPDDKVWNTFSTTSDECPGKKCSLYLKCYATRARRAAQAADIVVTNYHLFFMNMMNGRRVLPYYDYVIFDEGHAAADIARDVLGFKVSRGTFYKLAREASKFYKRDVEVAIRREADKLFDTLTRFSQSGHYKNYIHSKLPVSVDGLAHAVKSFVDQCPKSDKLEFAETSMQRVREAVEVLDENCVYSLEAGYTRQGQHDVKLVSKYIEPGQAMATGLWGDTKSVVVVSATMATDGNFDFVKKELGAPRETETCLAETPFDFQRQALLVLPEQLPEPNAPDFPAAVANAVIRTADACNGRTMGLFTSYKMMQFVADALARERPHLRVLTQGTASVRMLVDEFKAGHAGGVVLLGTTSFWTGVDVQGEALTGLVIDKLPFVRPDDPVTMRITEKDPRGAFAHHSIPKAIHELRQGVGRLIRAVDDRGAVVICDNRVITKGYGARFLKSLPNMARTRALGDIHNFLTSRGAA